MNDAYWWGGHVDAKTRIKIARNLLNNAIEMNINKKVIFKISQKIDEYIVMYYREYEDLKGEFRKEKK
ncbi:aspartyl-phosphate phosphatase Spo0E family protein [Caldicoprobacter sp.]|uniref:aspartyl-phosphate phosphatase Spo0E family protein n=1 Tax=Caldicoprobacter sp. TaxID=2004500 RepID=UPI0039C01AE8